jgi:hypothetical protein
MSVLFVYGGGEENRVFANPLERVIEETVSETWLSAYEGFRYLRMVFGLRIEGGMIVYSVVRGGPCFF